MRRDTAEGYNLYTHPNIKFDIARKNYTIS